MCIRDSNAGVDEGFYEPPAPTIPEAQLEDTARFPRATEGWAALAPEPGPASSSSTSMSARVGRLAEVLEREARVSDASLLYEVQAFLASINR